MCYDNCRYFRKDTETCRLGKGEVCPQDADHWPAWPPTSEEYGAWSACLGCPHEVDGEDACTLGDPKENCIRKHNIMSQLYPHEPFVI